MTMIEKRSNIEERYKVNLMKEQEWIRGRMRGDKFFSGLTTPQQEYAHAGRTYVVWTLCNGQPIFKALLRVQGFSLTFEYGLKIVFQVATPDRDTFHLEVSHQPKRLADFPLYLWVPAYCDLRYVPMNPIDPQGACLLSTVFVARAEERYRVRQEEGKTYFSAVKDFNEFWPAFAI